MKNQITEKKEVRISYWITCLICNKEIRGDSKKAALHNFKVHINSHKRKLKVKSQKAKGVKNV